MTLNEVLGKEVLGDEIARQVCEILVRDQAKATLIVRALEPNYDSKRNYSITAKIHSPFAKEAVAPTRIR